MMRTIPRTALPVTMILNKTIFIFPERKFGKIFTKYYNMFHVEHLLLVIAILILLALFQQIVDLCA